VISVVPAPSSPPPALGCEHPGVDGVKTDEALSQGNNAEALSQGNNDDPDTGCCSPRILDVPDHQDEGFGVRASQRSNHEKISTMVNSSSRTMTSVHLALGRYRTKGSKSVLDLEKQLQPPDIVRLRGVVDSPLFTGVASLVVVLHAVFLAIDTNYDLGAGLGSASFAGDCIFTAIYMLELAMRVKAYKHRYVSDPWNIMDMVLVGMSLADIIVVAAALSADPALSVMASFRMMRLLRLARLVRLFRFFKSLWLLVCGLAASMRTVLWAWLLIFLIIYIFGLCFVRIFAPYTCELSEASDEDLKDLDKYFGNVGRAMFSVFQVITLEDWTALAQNASVYEPWTRILFFTILGTCTWGVMHVITAVFVESSLEASSVRSTDLAKKAKEEYHQSCKCLSELFWNIDKSNDGSISKQEYMRALCEPGVREKLNAVGIDRNAASELFDILDIKGTKRLNDAEFVEGILRSCGPAQNKDLISMRCDVWRVEIRLQDEFDRACSFIQKRVQETTDRVEDLRKEVIPVLRRATASLQAIQKADIHSRQPGMEISKSVYSGALSRTQHGQIHSGMYGESAGSAGAGWQPQDVGTIASPQHLRQSHPSPAEVSPEKSSGHEAEDVAPLLIEDVDQPH
jgi:voltage-gated sodium channel